MLLPPFELRPNYILEKAVLMPLLVLLLLIAFVVIGRYELNNSSLLEGEEVVEWVGLTWGLYLVPGVLIEPVLFLAAVKLIGKEVRRVRRGVRLFLLQVILGPKNLMLMAERAK